MSDYEREINRIKRLSDYVKTQMDKPWLDWPTVREMALKYHCKQDDIIGIVEGVDSMDLIVGMRTGDGHGEFENKGDYRIEWFENE